MAKKIIDVFEFIVLALIVIAIYFLIKPFFMPIPYVTSVHMPQYIVTFLNEEYQEAEVEFAYCLNGEIENETAYITELLEPEEIVVYGEDEIAIKCPRNIIGTIHNHPNGVCSMSLQDAYTFGFTKEPIEGIICGVDNIVFYTPLSLEESVEVVFT